MHHMLLMIFTLSAFLPVYAQDNPAEIAIIIDDMGNKNLDALAFDLPTEVTFAILPNKPLSRVFSARAKLQSREVILHMPMQSVAGIKEEQNSLRADMNPLQMRRLLQHALDSVPHARGLNNHMGSKLTQLAQPMTVMMEFLLQHDLYFVDSRTTNLSQAQDIAQQTGVMALKRNVFLDHQADLIHIERQFKRLIRLAKKQGRAVAIAHPYPQTLAFLQKNLQGLDSQGISLVKLGRFIQDEQKSAAQVSHSYGSTVIAK